MNANTMFVSLSIGQLRKLADHFKDGSDDTAIQLCVCNGSRKDGALIGIFPGDDTGKVLVEVKAKEDARFGTY